MREEKLAYKWHCPAKPYLKWEHWDEESLLFDKRSSQTQTVTPLAVEVILFLEEGVFSTEHVMAHLKRLLGPDHDPKLIESVPNLLDQLEAIGIVELCPP